MYVFEKCTTLDCVRQFGGRTWDVYSCLHATHVCANDACVNLDGVGQFNSLTCEVYASAYDARMCTWYKYINFWCYVCVIKSAFLIIMNSSVLFKRIYVRIRVLSHVCGRDFHVFTLAWVYQGVYAFVHLNICTHSHEHIYIYIYTYIHAYIHTYVYIRIYVCMCVCIYIRIYTYIYIYIHTYIRIHVAGWMGNAIRTHAGIYTHTCVYVCMYVCMYVCATPRARKYKHSNGMHICNCVNMCICIHTHIRGLAHTKTYVKDYIYVIMHEHIQR
jgi:hypothetical protein